MKRNIFFALAILAVLLIVLFIFGRAAVSSSTSSQPAAVSAAVQTEIQGLLQEIVKIEQEIVALGGAPIAIPSTLQTTATTTATVASTTAAQPSTSTSALSCTFIRTLVSGSTGSDVTCLQRFLIAQNFLPADDATGYYGSLTQAAVQQFQARTGIVSSGTPASTGYGVVGPKTSAVIATQSSSASANAASSAEENAVASVVPSASVSAEPASTTATVTVSNTITVGKASAPSPTNGDITSGSGNTTLSWNDGGGAGETISISIDPSFPAKGTTQATLAAGRQSYTAAGLDPDTTYYWRVDTQNGNTTITGNVWHFTTGGTFVASCPAPKNPTLDFNEVNGVRTRFAIDGTNNATNRTSITPDLGSGSLLEMLTAIEADGANLGELNIDSFDSLNTSDQPDTADAVSNSVWQQYLDAYFVPPAYRTGPEQTLVAQVQQKIDNFQYTKQERDEAIEAFLQNTNDLACAGLINDNISFLIHQQYGLRVGPADFANDMVDIIGKLKQEGLDGWVSGIRLGENLATDGSANPNTNTYLYDVEQIAKAVNAASSTPNWLKNKAFLANGPEDGANYANIGNQSYSAGFFSTMDAQTGSFAFGYKWMRPSTYLQGSIGADMTATTCPANAGNSAKHACDDLSVADWTYYLNNTNALGFNDLATWINANRKAYPMQANVVFVGDNSDSLYNLTKNDQTGQHGDFGAAEFAALTALFQNARANSPTVSSGESGWDGKLFMEYSSNASMLHGAPDDSGLSLYFDNGTTMTPNPKSLAAWKSWLPAGGASAPTVSITVPATPIITMLSATSVQAGDTLTITGTGFLPTDTVTLTPAATASASIGSNLAAVAESLGSGLLRFWSSLFHITADFFTLHWSDLPADAANLAAAAAANGTVTIPATSADGTTITVTIPATVTAGTYTLTVTNSNGTSEGVAMVVGAASPATPQAYVAVKGNELVDQNGDTFLMKGGIIVSFAVPVPLMTVSGEPAYYQNSYTQWANYGDGDTMLAAAATWGLNTIRINVSEVGLDPENTLLTAAQRTQYVQSVDDAVAKIVADGFVADIVLNDEVGSGETTYTCLPTAATTRAWQTLLAQPFAAAQYQHAVVYELFNEPVAPDLTAASWSVWQNGSSDLAAYTPGASECPGGAIVGMNTLIKQIRATGADNVIIADGLQWAHYLNPSYPLQDSAGQLAYAVHPFFVQWPTFTLTGNPTQDDATFDTTFGDMQKEDDVPVVATAVLGGTASDSNLCVQGMPVIQAVLFNYLKDNHMGAIGWGFDLPSGLIRKTTDSSGAWIYTPTTYDSFVCGPAGGNGGELLQEWSLSNDPTPAASTLIATTTQATPVGILLGGLATGGMTVQIASQPANGTVSLSGDAATYTPAANFSGTDSFSYTVEDGSGDVSAPGEVSVTVSSSTTSAASVPTPAPTCTLTVTPTSVTKGQSTVLTWSTANATSISIINAQKKVFVTSTASTGTRTVTPGGTGVWVATVTGPSGTGTCNVAVTVTS